MICPACKFKCISVKSVVKSGSIVNGCEHCINGLIQGQDNARKYDRDRMKRDYAQDLVQPIDKDFAKRYGVQAAKEAGWSDESIRKHT